MFFADIACTFLTKHLYPLPMNPFGIMELIQSQPGLKCLQTICNRCLPQQGSIPKLFQPNLPPDYGPILFLKQSSHSSFLPLVELTIVGLPYPVGNLLQGAFGLLQADWGLTLCTAQVRQIIALNICIILIISVSNGSNPLERFRVRVGTGTEPLQRFLPHENPDHCNWAGFTTKNPAFQPHNFGSNQVFEF
jgi:hypothetical protein